MEDTEPISKNYERTLQSRCGSSMDLGVIYRSLGLEKSERFQENPGNIYSEGNEDAVEKPATNLFVVEELFDAEAVLEE